MFDVLTWRGLSVQRRLTQVLIELFLGPDLENRLNFYRDSRGKRIRSECTPHSNAVIIPPKVQKKLAASIDNGW